MRDIENIATFKKIYEYLEYKLGRAPTCREILKEEQFMIPEIYAYNEACKKLSQKFGREPTKKEIGEELNLPKEKISIIEESIFGSYHSIEYHDSFYGEEEGIDSLLDMIFKPNQVAEKNKLKRNLEMIIGKLDDNEAKIIKMRYGIEGPRYTSKQVGELFGITREKIKEIEQKVIQKLKDNKGLQIILGNEDKHDKEDDEDEKFNNLYYYNDDDYYKERNEIYQDLLDAIINNGKSDNNIEEKNIYDGIYEDPEFHRRRKSCKHDIPERILSNKEIIEIEDKLNMGIAISDIASDYGYDDPFVFLADHHDMFVEYSKKREIDLEFLFYHGLSLWDEDCDNYPL